jgi:hypothetical protein
MNTGFRLLCLICGILLITMSPTILSRKEEAVSLYIYGGESHYIFYKVLNGYNAVLGVFLTMVGFVFVIASYYHHEEYVFQ